MTNVTNKQQMKNRQLYLDISFVGWIIFLLFRIPITNIIGNEGNGYYIISFEIYTFIATIFGYCLYQTSREIVRCGLKKYNYRTRASLFSLLIFLSILISCLGAFVIYAISKYLLVFLQFELSGISLRLFCALIIVVSISGVFRGYFEGYGSKIPTAFSRIVEALVAGTGGIIFTSILNKYGSKVGALLYNEQYRPAFSAAGIVAGSLCGSLFALLFLFIVYQVYQRTQTKTTTVALEKEKNNSSLLKEIFKVGFLAFGNFIFFNSYRLSNLYLYITSISKQIQETNESINLLSLVGSYHGKILVLIGILILVILSFSGKTINRISQLYRKNKVSACYKYMIDEIKQIFIIAIPVTLLVVLLSKNILNLIYGNSNLTEINILKIASLNIIFIPLAIYLYRVMSKIYMNIALLMIPALAFVCQTAVMYFLVNIETTRLLSITIAEAVFWCLLFLMELILLLKEFGQILKK